MLLERVCWWCELAVGWAEPRCPSLMAVVERAERDVVVELGVPLEGITLVIC